ncbi:hypothetical protein E6C27_scaffold40G001190 [Cucumis melo var. makuwa]|uniref:Uncharacterized protein n=1 Tax=Cucumis melo var. makuwa TaxID=1194695 RepID=A0A5A7VH86_CUCMM|nr:hypothetical protein E6C27_scaffold40G001190 [Cucumis melo var. makuwa]
MVEREKVAFRAEAINELYGLPDKEDAYPCHQLINKPTKGLVRRMLGVIAWPCVDWESLANVYHATVKLQLYPHQLTIEASIWLFFIKIKILPMHHDEASV